MGVRASKGGCGKKDTTTRHYNEKRRKMKYTHTENVFFTTWEEVERYYDNVKLYCLECGHEFASLGLHLYHVHAMKSKEYCKRHGLPTNRGLLGSDLRQRTIEKARNLLQIRGGKIEGAKVFDGAYTPPKETNLALKDRRRISAIKMNISHGTPLSTIRKIVDELPVGGKLKDLCDSHGISCGAFYRGCGKYGIKVPDLRKTPAARKRASERRKKGDAL